MTGRSTYLLWVGVALELACVCLMACHGDFTRAGEARKFNCFGVAAGMAFWLAVSSLRTAGVSVRAGGRWFWIVAVVVRLAMLPTYPGDDFWRYRWEGRIQLFGFNPYALSPDAPALAPLHDGEWEKINERKFAAIYPPLTELVFEALAAAHVPVPGYKLLFALADLGTIGILRRLLTRRRAPPDAVVWYAWNPLVVYTSAGAAHFDSLMTFALCAAILMLDRFSDAEGGRRRANALAVASALLLGIAIAVKAVPVVLLPVWAFVLGWRRAVMFLPVAVAVSPVLAIHYGFPEVPVFQGLQNFAQYSRLNDCVWWLLDPSTSTSGVCQWIAAGVCAALAIWLRRDWRRATLWVMGAALLLAPLIHAWYVVWVLPLAAWRGGTAQPWFVLSVSMFGYFLLWEVNADPARPWQEPIWLRLGIYLPFLAAWVWTALRRRLAGAAEGEAW